MSRLDKSKKLILELSREVDNGTLAAMWPKERPYSKEELLQALPALKDWAINGQHLRTLDTTCNQFITVSKLMYELGYIQGRKYNSRLSEEGNKE